MIPYLLTAAWAGTRGAVADVPLVPEPGDAVERVAVVIGVDAYGPDVGDLSYATKDADDLAAVLGANGGGSFDVVALYGRPIGRDEIWAELHRATAGLGPEDVLLVYFAGHGGMSWEGGAMRLFLLASDAVRADPVRTAIDYDALRRWFSELPVLRKVLVVDACHNELNGASDAAHTRGRVPDALRGVQLRGEVAAPWPVRKAEVHLLAAREGQPAREHERLENGVFTHFLVEGLSRGPSGWVADVTGDGLVAVDEAYAYAEARTRAFTDEAQVPVYRAEREGDQEIWLTGDAWALTSREDATLSRLRGAVGGASRGGGGRRWSAGAVVGVAWTPEVGGGTPHPAWALRTGLQVEGRVGLARPAGAVVWDLGLGRAPADGALLDGGALQHASALHVDAALRLGGVVSAGPVASAGALIWVREDTYASPTLGVGGAARVAWRRLVVDADLRATAVVVGSADGGARVAWAPQVGISAGFAW